MIKSLKPEEAVSPQVLNIFCRRDEGIPLVQKSQCRKRIFLSLRLAAALIARLSLNVVRVCSWMRLAAAARKGLMVSKE